MHLCVAEFVFEKTPVTGAWRNSFIDFISDSLYSAQKFARVSWLIYVTHESFISVTWCMHSCVTCFRRPLQRAVICMCAMHEPLAPLEICMRATSHLCAVPWLIYMCDMMYSCVRNLHVCHDWLSLPWLIYACDDPFMYAMTHLFVVPELNCIRFTWGFRVWVVHMCVTTHVVCVWGGFG